MRSFDAGLAILITAWALVAVLPAGAWVGMADLAYYRGAWALWGRTGLVVALGTLLLLVLTRGGAATGLHALLARAVTMPRGRLLVGLGALAAFEAALVNVWCFARNPQLVDTWVQYFQARLLLAGRLTAPPPPSIGHFAVLHTMITDRAWFGQYPPIHPALLAVGMAAGVPWLVTPVLSALLPAAVYALGRRTGDERVARLAAALSLLSPFVIGMGASAMNHVPAALCAAAGLWAVPGVARGRAGPAAVLGVAVGLLAGLRPLDAATLALVGGVAHLAALGGRGGPAALAAAMAGAALAVSPTLACNAATTGHPLTFGYAALWTETRWLGFHHPVPAGDLPLTPARALGFTALDGHQLDRYLFEWPVPVTALIAGGLWLRRASLDAGARTAASFLVALVAVLFFYYHRDTLFGPRYLFSAVPAVLVLAAFALVALGEVRWPLGWRELRAGDAVLVAAVVMIGLSAVLLAPRRLATYGTRGTALALHPADDAARAGVHGALVVIPDGWGTRLIARLWDAGVPMSETTPIYHALDACALEERLSTAEAAGVRGAALLASLREAMAGADPGRRAPGVTPDPLLRLPSDGRLTPRCAEEIAYDRRGTLQFAPFLHLNTPGLDGDVVWARALGPRDATLAAHFPGRTIYRYEAPPGASQGTFVPR